MAEASEAQSPGGASSSQSGEQERAATENLAAPIAEAQAGDTAPATEAHALDDASGSNAAAPAEGEAQQSDAPREAGAAEGEGESAAGAEAGDAAGSGKRKRRRRKKRKGDTEAGEHDAAASAAGEGAEAKPHGKRRENAAPFLRFFIGAHAGRKHGFAASEVVAGRVKEVKDGTIAVDLFGKAVAYADEFEPREVPPAREILREAAHEAELASAAASSEAQPAGDPAPQSAAETAPSEGEPSSAATEIAAAPAPAAPSEALAEPAQEAAQPAPEADAQASHETDAGLRDAALEAVALEAEAAAAEAESDAEHTLSGEGPHASHGPLPPAPIVPEHFPRLEPPALGQVFRGRVAAIAESGHIALVNREIDRAAVMANMQRYRDQRRRVQGLVFGFNRGGFDVLVETVRAFCPASAMSLEEIEDPHQLLGQKFEFLLPASQSVTKDVIVSRRSILERLQRKKAKELVRSLEPGQRFKGRVTAVRDFGLFVDIGGVEGLVHQSELSYAHGAKPGDVAAVGDEVEVQVLRVGGDGRKPAEGGRKDRIERVSLSIKALLPDPWDAHADVLREGSAHAAKITRTTDFGAFVELAPQVEGLLHITELGRDLKHADQVVKEGDEIHVVIERVDKRARRISLSKLSAQELEDWKAGETAGEAPRGGVRPGSRIKVKVARVENRGLLVRVSGVLGKRARGYLPANELAGDRGDLRKGYPIGTELEVKVVGIDRDGGLRCSVKALQVDDERRAVKDYRREAAKQGFGTFGDLLRAKLGQADTK